MNVENVDLSALGHGYVAECRDVLRDMHDILTHGTPPNQRFGLRRNITQQGEEFWIIRT